ncbi:unnamed protein product, partial [Meganyctiphanes norvegica]
MAAAAVCSAPLAVSSSTTFPFVSSSGGGTVDDVVQQGAWLVPDAVAADLDALATIIAARIMGRRNQHETSANADTRQVNTGHALDLADAVVPLESHELASSSNDPSTCDDNEKEIVINKDKLIGAVNTKSDSLENFESLKEESFILESVTNTYLCETHLNNTVINNDFVKTHTSLSKEFKSDKELEINKNKIDSYKQSETPYFISNSDNNENSEKMNPEEKYGEVKKVSPGLYESLLINDQIMEGIRKKGVFMTNTPPVFSHKDENTNNSALESSRGTLLHSGGKLDCMKVNANDVSRQISQTSDMGDEITEEEFLADMHKHPPPQPTAINQSIHNNIPDYIPIGCHSLPPINFTPVPRNRKTSEYETDSSFSEAHSGSFRREGSFRRDSFRKTMPFRRDSTGSRKTSTSSSITPDDDIDLHYHSNRKISNSSGISSCTSDIINRKLSNSSCGSDMSNRKFSNTSVTSDNWEWFPGRKKSFRGLCAPDDSLNKPHVPTFGTQEKSEVRKSSAVSAFSNTSSGIGSMSGSDISDIRKTSDNSGITNLTKIKEESKINLNDNVESPESYDEGIASLQEELICHNSTVDGRPLSLPPPVWPKGFPTLLRNQIEEQTKSLNEDTERKISNEDKLKDKIEMFDNISKGFVNTNVNGEQKRNEMHKCQTDDITHDQIVNQSVGSKYLEDTSIKPFTRIRLPKDPSINRVRRLTLHTFENIAEEWKTYNKDKQLDSFKTSASREGGRYTFIEGDNEGNTIRKNLVRDLEKLEAEIDAEVLSLKNKPKKSILKDTKCDRKVNDMKIQPVEWREMEDSSSIIVSYDSTESMESHHSLYHESTDTEKEDDAVEGPLLSDSDAEMLNTTIRSSEPTAEQDVGDDYATQMMPVSIKESKSLPNLSDVGEACLLDEGGSSTDVNEDIDKRRESVKTLKSSETLTSIEEIIPSSNYEFSQVTFPLIAPVHQHEEQEAIEHFSDEDLNSNIEFEPFSETEQDLSDMENLNLDLFEPTIKHSNKVDGKMLSKRQKKMRKIKRKFSFSSTEKPSKDIKDSISSSLQRMKDAKDKITRLVHKTLKSETSNDSAPPPSPGMESLGGSLGSRRPRIFITEKSTGSLGRGCSKTPLSSEIPKSVFLDRQDSGSSKTSSGNYSMSSLKGISRNSSIASEMSRSSSSKASEGQYSLDSAELAELRFLADGQESICSWSDAESDFEFIAMGPGRQHSLLQEVSIAGLTEEERSRKPPSGAHIGSPYVGNRTNLRHLKAHSPMNKDRDVRLGHRASNAVRADKVPLATWEPFFCVLLQDETTFTTYRSEEMAIGDSLFYDLPRMRLDGGARAFRRRWGYDLTPPPTLVEEEDEEDPYSLPNDEDDDISYTETRSLRDDFLFHHSQDTSYEKASCADNRRGSAPATPILGARSTDPASQTTPNRLVNFFSKRSFKSNPLKRTKSVTKLERSRRGGGVGSLFNTGGDGGTDPLALGGSRLRSSRSHESLLASHNMMNTLDLAAGEVTIKPLHSSILGQDHCFQVTSPTGTRYFSCRTAEERDRWVESLRKAVNPNYQHMRRTENSVKVFILEAKGVSTKKKYFCELLLDGCLYARTSSKSKSDMCFWGEQFEFHSLPSMENITVALYREAEKRRKKEKSIAVGVVNIPVMEVTSRSHIEKWYPVQIENNKNATKDPPALRIKCKFQSVDILPMELYADFLTYVKGHYAMLCEVLEPCVSVKAKEDIATSLVYIMQREGKARHFLADLVTMEIDRIDDAHLLFRGNSLATKAMEAFMKLVGEKYLLDTLRQVINRVVDEKLDCEVDPMKMPQISSIQKQQENLVSIVRMTWSRILNSHPFFPQELRECFCLYRERLASYNKGYLTENLISASIFLRFLCPAILSPSLFNITQEYPDERSSRNLTLIAKTLQTLANFTKFQGKENFMEFMNEFIETEQAQMRIFLKQISSPIDPNDHRGFEFDGDIDVGKQLSLLHTLLSEALGKVSKANIKGINQQQLNTLHNILEDISIAKTQPNINLVQRLSASNPTKVLTPTNDPQTSFEESIGYQSLQKNIFRYNDPTVSNGFLREAVPPSPVSTTSSPSSPRSSTLPRNTYLNGSGRRPAINLNTADDYVLYSALEGEEPRVPNPLGHSYSHSHLVPGPNRMTPTPVHTSAIHNKQNFNNQNGWHNNNRENSNDPQTPNGNSNGNNNNNREEGLNVSQEENDKSSIEETDANLKGSQTSISQLSNIASSGYQSFAYSQSSSPVDPTISHHDSANNNNNNGSSIISSSSSSSSNGMQASPQLVPTPLAFNNPMFHLRGGVAQPGSSPRPVPSHRAMRGHHHYYPLHKSASVHHHSPLSSSLSSSHSVEELTTHLPTSHRGALSPIQSSQHTRSSSSEDLGSLVCTPPEVRSHNAPRTNPRCLPPGRKTSAPEHHHSTSDLLGPNSWRNKMNRRQSTGSARRDQRFKYESDSSSDCEQTPPQPRVRPQRPAQRSSKTTSKTLDEYEQEILAMRSAMEEMHNKLVSAEEAIAHETIAQNSDLSPSQLPLQNPADLHNHYSNSKQVNGSSGHSSRSNSSSSSYNGVSKQTQPNSGSPPKIPELKAATSPNDHMKDLLTNILVQEEFEREKQKMKDLMYEKDAVIQAQENRINALDQTNSQLLKALGQVKELNLGPTEDSNTCDIRGNQQISDTSDYKSSSC